MTFKHTHNLTKEQIKKVLPEVVSYKKLNHENSFSNLMYELKTKDREYILRCPDPLVINKTENEVAVMKFLKKKTKIPLPKIYGYALDKKEIGLEYILMEKIEGIPLSDIWDNITIKQRLNYTKQIANIFVQMKKFSFDKIGGFDINMKVTKMVLNQKGPFNNFETYIKSTVNNYLKIISKNEFKEYVPKFKKFMKYIKDVSMSLTLTHTDMAPKNIMVNKDKITALLDYEWCCNAPYVEDIMNCPSDLELHNYPVCEKEFFKILKKNKIPSQVPKKIQEIYEIQAMAMRLAYHRDWFHGKEKQRKIYIKEKLKELDEMFAKVKVE